jgi:DNA-binding transcriptional regulator GbsR (MarR family)
MEQSITINQTFSQDELAKAGLKELDVHEISAKVFTKGDRVYFFDETDQELYRLFSVIHKRSFFL